MLFFLSLFPIKEQPVELGNVNWIRDYDKALASATEADKPVFILFQEVPGCIICRNYGQDVLSHPLIVEAIEELFVPLAIFNNKGGDDAKILKKYNEPSWNNPVVRIIEYNEKAIANRISGNYSQQGIVDAMMSALVSSGREVPIYLRLLQEELLAEKNESEFALSMYCFWSGEKELAAIKGVVATEAGFMDGHEVVKVKFDEDKTSIKQIYKEAKKANVADCVYVTDDNDKKVFKDAKTYSGYRKDNQTKYYLYKSPYKALPLLPIQELKVNRALATRQDPQEYLSPRQITLFQQLQNNKSSKSINRIGGDFREAWDDLTSEK